MGCAHSRGVSDWLHGPPYWVSSIEPCFDDCKITDNVKSANREKCQPVKVPALPPLVAVGRGGGGERGGRGEAREV
jgi:hypothetical protein